MSRDLQALQLFEQALELPKDQLPKFLDRACGRSTELRQKVETLLAAHGEARDYLASTNLAAPEADTPSAAIQGDTADTSQSRQRLQGGDFLLDRYEIRQTIGCGGMGEVYRAWDNRLKRDVALKVLNLANLGDQAMQDRFEREIRAVASLSHPNIMTLHDVADQGDVKFAIMEFVPGCTLRDAIGDRMSWRQAVGIAHQVSMALGAAHSQGIMHRDIKPENIIVSECGHTKVLDFGLARHVALPAEQELTASATLPGTVPYMSPEQIVAEELTCSTDVFSLGTVLVEMLSGTNPFRAKSVFETMQRINAAATPPLDTLADDVPDELATIVKSMLRRDSERRPDAAEIAQRLSQLLHLPNTPNEPTSVATEDERVLRDLLEGVSGAVGTDYFRELVRGLAQALGTYCAMVTEFDREHRRARALAFWSTDGWVEGYEYTIANTPCEAVFEKQELYHHPDNLQGLFPDDHDLPEMGLVSYMGVPLIDVDGTVLGNLAVIDRKPMPRQPRCIGLMRLFATRAAAEHRRLKREGELRDRERNLNRLLDEVAEAIVEVDEALTITQFNRAAETAFGCQANAALGRTLTHLLDSPDEAALREFLSLLDSDPSQSDSSVELPSGIRFQTSGESQWAAAVNVSSLETNTGRFYTFVFRNTDATQPRTGTVRQSAQQLRAEINAAFSDKMIGSSEVFRTMLRDIQLVSSTDTTVLISGETGTGKELAARAIHASSGRSAGPFVVADCSQLPTQQAERELFGHLTRSGDAQEGFLAQAHGGTLVLDNVSDLPLEAQAKLVRALQEQEFRPLGSSVAQTANVRVIAMTEKDLSAEVAAGRFREDLYYRLNVFPIAVPPLRKRGRDVLRLATSFAREMDNTMRRGFSGLSPECESQLLAHPWPGNIRELRNVVERSLITSTRGMLDLSGAFRNGISPDSFRQAINANDDSNRVMTQQELCDLERRNILQALKVCNGKIGDANGAAELLGIEPSILDSRIRELGIQSHG